LEKNLSDLYIIYTGNAGKVIDHQIKVGNKVFSIPSGSTVDFKMRYAANEVIKTNEAASIKNASSGQVEYSWKSTDLDEPGEYYAWWSVNLPTYTLESKEFLVIVAEHAPGLRTKTGAIYNAAKSFMPLTWSKLEESNHYGDKLLQGKVDVAKLGLLGYELSAEDEENLDIRVIDYLAKISVISVIPAGKDYWASMAQSKTAGSPDEIVSYPDRIEMLEQLHDQLTAEISKQRDIIGDLIDLPSIVRPNSIPEFSPGTDEGYITPNPNLNFRDYGFPVYHNRYGRRNAVRRRGY